MMQPTRNREQQQVVQQQVSDAGDVANKLVKALFSFFGLIISIFVFVWNYSWFQANGLWLLPIVVTVVVLIMKWPVILKAITDYQDRQAKRESAKELNKAQAGHLDAKSEDVRASGQIKAAEAWQKANTFPFDPNGNLAWYDWQTRRPNYMGGQAPAFPELRSFHNTEKYTGLPGESLQGLLPPGNIQRLTIDNATRHITQQLESCLGSSLRNNGAPILADWSESHILIIGSTRMGKSCEAGNILRQAEKTHAPEHLQIAMLDAEYKTSRLFEHSPLLLKLDVKGRRIVLHAKNLDEVPAVMHLLAMEAERRDRLEEWELAELPHILAYFEEFLNTKKQIKARFPKQFDTFLTDFNMLTTRGVKLGIQLMLCAQVNYADEDLRDSMAQFSGLNISFCVNPTAARSAGFVETDLLNENYRAKQRGQFVVESMSGNDIGLAPDFDVKERIKLLSTGRNQFESGSSNHFPLGQTTITEEPGNQVETGSKVDGNQFGNQFQSASEANLDKKVQECMVFMTDNPGANVGDVISHVWKVKPGRSEAYQQARREYVEVQKRYQQYALRGMQQQEEA